MKSPRLTRREHRQVQLTDLPQHIPAEVRAQALDILKSRDYIVYIGNPRGPKWMRNQWLVVRFASLGAVPETVAHFAEQYYSFRQAYDAWEKTPPNGVDGVREMWL